MKKRSFRAACLGLTTALTRFSIALALTAFWLGQPLSASGVERSVLCEEFTNKL